MLVKCSFCGKQKIVENELYSSPLFRCEGCGKLFYDNKIKEPALNPPPVNEREKISFLIYLGIPMGLVGTIFGFWGMISYETEFLFMLIFCLLMTVGDCFWIYSSYRDRDKRNEYYQKLLNDSHQRLSKLSYQKQLIVASNGNTDIVSLLEKYNKSHHLDYVLDVEDILHNYEAENITVSEQKKTKAVNVAEGISICEDIQDNTDIKLFCRKCGTELLLDSTFCHRCGKKVEIN